MSSPGTVEVSMSVVGVASSEFEAGAMCCGALVADVAAVGWPPHGGEEGGGLFYLGLAAQPSVVGAERTGGEV